MRPALISTECVGYPIMSVMHTLTTPGQLDQALIRRVSAGEQVVIGPALAGAVGVSCAAARRALADGPVYGVSTGMGALAGVALTAEEQAGHQRRLLAGRAAGGPPWLDAPAVRALFAVRLRT